MVLEQEEVRISYMRMLFWGYMIMDMSVFPSQMSVFGVSLFFDVNENDRRKV